MTDQERDEGVSILDQPDLEAEPAAKAFSHPEEGKYDATLVDIRKKANPFDDDPAFLYEFHFALEGSTYEHDGKTITHVVKKLMKASDWNKQPRPATFALLAQALIGRGPLKTKDGKFPFAIYIGMQCSMPIELEDKENGYKKVVVRWDRLKLSEEQKDHNDALLAAYKDERKKKQATEKEEVVEAPVKEEVVAETPEVEVKKEDAEELE